MRNSIKAALCGILLLCTSVLFSQEIYKDARHYIDSLCKVTSRDSNLISYPGLNIFMAKKVNTYLAGSGDLSLNKSYFIIDPADGRFFLGINKAKDPSLGVGRTKNVLTAGVKADIKDAFSTIYAGSKKSLSPNIGASIKFTLLGKGKVGFDHLRTQQQLDFLNLMNVDIREMREYKQSETGDLLRELLKFKIEDDIRTDSTTNYKRYFKVSDRAWGIQEAGTYVKSRNKKYKREFIENEASAIEDNELYNWYKNSWISFDFYIPFTRQSFDVAENFVVPVKTVKLYNFDASILWSMIYENKKSRLLSSFVLGVKGQNNVLTEDIDKHSIGEYKKLGGVDTLRLAQLESNEVYVGNYKEFVSPVVKFQFVDYFLFSKKAGFSFLAEKFMGIYNPLNVKLGLPFNLQGKDDDSKVNFEIQFKWNDYGNNIYPDKKRSEKFVIGLSVGVPLTSKIY